MTGQNKPSDTRSTPQIRKATLEDSDAIADLIAASARGLGRDDYPPEEIEAALGGVWGVDTQLIRDGTYFLVYLDDQLAACGGWSYRQTLFGSDGEAERDPAELDPATDAARIRAFFVHPDFARRGIGSLLLDVCEQQARKAGFRALSLGATLPGQKLYAVRGFVAGEPIDHTLGNGRTTRVIPMTKVLSD